VLGWGSGASGQLGNGSTTSSLAPVPARTRVTGLFAGCFSTVALTAAGKVLAWGDNGEGAAGDGTSVLFRRLPQRVKLPAGVTVFAVSSGSRAEFSLAIG
jgi:alpha-tubulin suppressor-like RCC1 family protein